MSHYGSVVVQLSMSLLQMNFRFSFFELNVKEVRDSLAAAKSEVVVFWQLQSNKLRQVCGVNGNICYISVNELYCESEKLSLFRPYFSV